TLDDIGFKQQAEIFEQVADHLGEAPAVMDSADILANPQMELRKLCAHIDLEFHPSMLRWPKGGHKDDGPWASHWYQSVWKSTGFGKVAASPPKVPEEFRDLLEEAQPFYEMMSAYTL
ncbi:MAG: HAD family hydrolase, partial [Verrucomicrobia bacterium]|nr:HAD family hydrolase [Verrucomicrobiota bacterium]